MQKEFFVAGTPAPGGSKRAFRIPGTERVNVVESGGSKTKIWREAVREQVRGLWDKPIPREVPVFVMMQFIMRRPSAHYGKNGLKPWAVNARPTTKPDVLKLGRSTEDAMTGVLWIDDSQNVDLWLRKSYTNDGRTGCLVTVIWGEDMLLRVEERVWRHKVCDANP